jgi:hypothetical protein
MQVRRFILGVAAILATVPFDFACSKEEDEPPGGDVVGTGGNDDIDLGGDGGAGVVVGTTSCASFVGLSNCEEQGNVAGKNEVNLLLVMDKSGSMDDTGGFVATKWETMKTALEQSLKKVAVEVNIGMALYPFPDNPRQGISKDTCGETGNCCEMPSSTEPNIPVGPGTETVDQIIDSFELIRPGGGTPTSFALDAALDYYVNGSGKDLEGDKYVVLATDGGPNCNSEISCEVDGCTLNIEERNNCPVDGPTNCCTGTAGVLACLDDVASIDAVSRLADAGVQTFVIGVPGSEQYGNVLDQLAEEGGRALVGEETKYFQVQAAGGVNALAGVFSKITQDLVTSCDIQLSEEPISLIDVNVAVDCEIVEKDDAAVGAGGAGGASAGGEQWRVDTNTSPPTVRLMGALCDRVEAGVDRVDVVLGCPSVH